MKDYPIIESLYSNRFALRYFSEKYPDAIFQNDVALIGVTYAGTGELMEAIQRIPSVVLNPKIYNAKNKVKNSKIQKIKNVVKKILGKEVVNFDEDKICSSILKMHVLAKFYLMGVYYPIDSEERALLSNILRLCPSVTSIPYEGRVVSILADTYGFTGSGFYGIEAFNEPWYYTNQTDFIMMFRNPSEMVYAGFKNEYDRLYWKQDFEKIIGFDWIEDIVNKGEYPSFDRMIKKIHPLLHRGFHKEALSLWMKHFPDNQFYFIDNLDLKNNEDGILKSISRLLKIPFVINRVVSHDVGRFSHNVFSFPKLKENTRNILDKFFSHYNEGLDKLLLKCKRIFPTDSSFIMGGGGIIIIILRILMSGIIFIKN